MKLQEDRLRRTLPHCELCRKPFNTPVEVDAENYDCVAYNVLVVKKTMVGLG